MADLDAKLGIAISTSGVEAIRKLAADVQQLAAEGGEAAPEFAKLAAEIGKIANQAAGVTAIDELRGEIAQLATTQEQAAVTSKEHRAELARLEDVVKAAAAAQRAAQDSSRQAAAEAGRAGDALKAYRTESSASEQQTREYAAEIKRLSAAQLAAKEASRQAKEEVARAGQALNDAKQAVKGYGEAITASDNALKSANSAVTQRTADLDKLADALRKGGVETLDLSAAQNQLRTSFQAAYAAVNQQQAAIVRSAEDQERLARISAAVAEANLRNVRLAQDAAAKRSLAEQQAAAAAEQTAARQEAAARRAFDAIEVGARKAAEAQARIKASAEAAARALDDAFAKTGVRAANAIEAEIRQVDQALVRLASDAKVSGAEFSRAFASGQARIAELRRELSGVPAEINKTGDSLGFLKGQLAQLAAIYSGVELAKRFFEANVELQTLQRSLTAVTGSSEKANTQIAFLQKVANDSGLAVGSLAQDFLRFNASATGAGKSTEFINQTFETVANGAGRLGISTQRVGLIFNALTQTISKGKPTLEELQGQLSESLPGGLSILANGLGVTTQQLLAMVKAGELTNDEFFSGLTRGLEGLIGQTEKVNSLAAAWNRFKNALTQAAQQANDSAGLRALASVLDAVASNMGRVVDGGFAIAKALVAIKAVNIVSTFLGLRVANDAAAVSAERAALAATQQAAATARGTAATVANTVEKRAGAVADETLAAAARTGTAAIAAETAALAANTAATAANAAAKKGAAAVVSTAATHVGAFVAASAGATQGAGLLTGAMGALRTVGSRLLGVFGGLPGVAVALALTWKDLVHWGQELVLSLAGASAAEKELAKQFAAEATAAKEAAAARREKQAIDDAAFRTLTQQINKQVEIAETQVKVTDKLAEARKLEGQATREIIALSGDEQASRVQAASSATAYAEAVARNAAARAAEVELLRKQVAQIEEAAKRTGGLTAAREEELTKIKEVIAVKEAELEKSRQTAAAAEIEAAGLKLTALAYQDNADNLAKYKEELDGARDALRAVRELQQQGLATQELVNKVTIAAAVAEAKYRDAITDTTAAVQRRIALNQADQGIAQARINLQIQEYKNEEAIATAVGNTSLALYNKIRQKELEAQSVRNAAKAKADEAKIEIERAAQERAELELLNKLTPEKDLELTLRTKNAEQKAIEAKTGKAAADAIDAETAALKLRTAAIIEDSSAAHSRALQTASDAEEVARRARNDAALSGGSFDDLPAGANSRGTTNTVGAMVGKQFIPPGAKYRVVGKPELGYYFPGEDDPTTVGKTPQQIIADEQARLAAARTAGGYVAPAPTSSTKNVSVTINLGGTSSTLYGSQSDVDAFLRAMEEAKRSAGG